MKKYRCECRTCEMRRTIRVVILQRDTDKLIELLERIERDMDDGSMEGRALTRELNRGKMRPSCSQ